MIDRKGFTLTELLASLVIIGILFGVVIYLVRGTFASTMTQYDNINDNMIFEAARSYVLETDAFGSKEYACVKVKELFEYGYLNNAINDNRIVKVIRNNTTKVIEEIKYAHEC